MSYISGNTFFIENAINCSNLGTINGSVSFLDTSSNCGQVLNAIFSGGVNCGQACGCTIFCNSCNFGYVCGTGILRGNSVLYGSADCVIQCDQSTIDAGASVASCNFLITIGIPTNIYSNDSCYYTYSNGECTLTTGGWSNYYFLSGAISSNTYIQTGQSIYAIPYQAQDNCLYYHSANSCLAYVVDGAYANGYFSSGCVNCNFSSICVLNPSGYTLGENQNPNQWYLTYNSGTVAVANGLLPRVLWCGLILLDFFKNGFVDPSCSSTVGMKYISTLNGYVCLALAGCTQFEPYVSDAIYGCCQVGYVYCFATPNGTTSSGYFNSSCEGLSMYSQIGATKVIPIDVTFTCGSALQAQDDSLYYTYCTGGAIVANGLYSNYAITGGVVDATYSTNMPTGAIDGGCLIYENGAALCVDNVNYILDNCRYYGDLNDLQDVAFQCGQPFAYKSCLCWFSVVLTNNELLFNLVNNALLCNGIFHYGNCSFTYSNVINECTFNKDERTEGTPLLNNGGTYFLYCNGSGIIPNGLYSNYAFDNSIFVNTAYDCTLPQISLDNCCYYVYSAGVAVGGTTGAFSNYYFEPAENVATTCSIATPIQSQDTCCYYLYTDGIASIPSGPYSNFYFDAISNDRYIATTCNITPPISGLDNGLFYNYCAGVSALASGPYSNFAFFEGVICTTFQIVCTALDNSCVYKYTDGVAMYTVCPQGTNLGYGAGCCYDVGACFQGGCGDGTITVEGDCCFLIGCNYCCADGADNCGLAYCGFGAWVCYCLYDEGSSSYCLACCIAVNQ